MVTISARVEDATKASAEQIADDIGISLSAAINIFLKRFVAENGFPFDVRRKTDYTELSTEEITKALQKAVAGDPSSRSMPPVSYLDPETQTLVTK